jgi:hypothetical protein
VVTDSLLILILLYIVMHTHTLFLPVFTGRLTDDLSVQTMNVMGFQRVMVDMGKEAYHRYAKDRLDMSSLTLSISEATLKEMKEGNSCFSAFPAP